MTTYNTVKYPIISALLVLLFPLISFAQFNENEELSDFGNRITSFISDILVPFVLAVALLLFIYGIYLDVIAGASEDNKRKEGRKFLLWSIIAFVVILSVWGIVNLIAGGIGLDTQRLDPGKFPKIPPR